MTQVTVDHDDDGDSIIVQMPYDDDAKEALKEQFDALWNPADKAWVIDARDHDIEDVKKELRLHFPRASL